ncbi:MAG TPA: mannosyl-3-phosphoglycerate synthase [Acidimicrobiia bacterium]|jgi:mannosyl-3-phosphoglycerate synthase
MRITFPAANERIGAVRFYEAGRIIELDSAGDTSDADTQPDHAFLSAETLEETHRRLTIVVPIKNERRSTLRGVLAGIPGACRVVVISASDPKPIDRFRLEREVIDDFVEATGREVVHFHQRDAVVAAAVETALPELLDDGGLVRLGKGEAMLLGTMIARETASAAVGFIDADNYVPGAVNEYVRIFSATIASAATDHTMGRISWQSKPKVEDGSLVFNRWGRSTTVSNRVLNEVVSHYLGEGTRIVTTGNAGEHVVSMPLAERLRFRGSFGAETGQLIDLLEQFGGIIEPIGDVPDRIDVIQTETINPHFHEDKGDEHVAVMRNQSVATIIASPICPAHIVEAYDTDASAPQRYPALEGRPGVDIERIEKVGVAGIDA